MVSGKVRGIAIFLLFAPALLLAAPPVTCQQLPVKTYTTANGLPRNLVQSVFSDSRGSLWFCTGDGLSFFNGYEFITYHLRDGLPHPFINAIIEGRNGTLWVATNGGGVCEFQPYAMPPSANRFFVYKVGDSFSSNRVNSLYEDRSGHIWAATDQGVFRLTLNDTARQFRAIEIESLTGAAIRCFTEDKEGALWIGSSGRPLVRLLPDGRALRYSGAPMLRVVNTLLTDPEGRVWIGTGGQITGEGIYVLRPEALADVDDKRTVPWRKLVRQDIDLMGNSPFAMPGAAGDSCLLFSSRNKKFNDVWEIQESRRASIWVSTNGGLGEFDGQQFRIYTVAQGLPTNELKSSAEDRDGNLWVATNEGVTRITLNSFIRFGETEGLNSSLHSQIIEDRQGNLLVLGRSSRPTLYRFAGSRFVAIPPRYPPSVKYFGWGPHFGFQHRSGEWWMVTGEGLCRFPRCTVDELAHTACKAFYTTRDGLQTNDIFGIFEDSRGDVWVGDAPSLSRWKQQDESFHSYGEADGLPAVNGPSAFCEDRFGNLWVGFFEGGVARYANDRFTLFSAADGLAGHRVRTLYMDRKGRLWIGTDTEGVARLDDTSAERPAFIYYTTAQGLAANNISSITEDHFGRIYLGHPRGIDRLTPENGSIKHYTAADGLQSEILGAYCDRQGSLWFTTVRGLYRLTPTADEPGQTPPIFINRVRIAGHDQQIAETGQLSVAGLELSSSQNQIEINFFGLGFEAGESLRYQYLLEGANHEWSSPSPQRMVNFASLAPGRYRFLVRTINADGVLSAPPASFSFRILPPLWQRWWFITLGGLLLAALAYSFYRYRLTRLLELERVRTRIAADLHDDIGANLTRIAILSEVAYRQIPEAQSRPENPLASIATIARESVASMSDIVWAINPKRDSLLDLVQRMRNLASEILGSRQVDCEFLTPESDQYLRLGVDVRRNVLLIFKEALNNLARHSACSSADIELRLERPWLILTLKDNGRGFDPAALSEGNGLVSMKRRADHLGGELQVISSLGQGTEIRLKVPYR
jgi:ligand-binding sensor domain-containing protein/signal transduction histidine kinase